MNNSSIKTVPVLNITIPKAFKYFCHKPLKAGFFLDSQVFLLLEAKLKAEKATKQSFYVLPANLLTSHLTIIRFKLTRFAFEVRQ